MKAVGDKLADYATKCGQPEEADLFHRSAFNRYYYSAFLHIRFTLKQIDPKWAEPSHKEVPDLLRKTVVNKVKTTVKTFAGKGYGKNQDPHNCVYRSQHAASQLATVLSQGYGIRKIADYEPEILVENVGNSVELGGIKLADAKNWSVTVEKWSVLLLGVFRDLGLVS